MTLDLDFSEPHAGSHSHRTVSNKCGWDTAKAVLAVSKEEILKRVDLEEETVDEVLAILSAEFED